MKMTVWIAVFLLACSAMGSQAVIPTLPADPNVTLALQQESVPAALTALFRQAGVAYRLEEIPGGDIRGMITVQLVGVRLSSAVRLVLREANPPLVFRRDSDGTYVISPRPAALVPSPAPVPPAPRGQIARAEPPPDLRRISLPATANVERAVGEAYIASARPSKLRVIGTPPPALPLPTDATQRVVTFAGVAQGSPSGPDGAESAPGVEMEPIGWVSGLSHRTRKGFLTGLFSDGDPARLPRPHRLDFTPGSLPGDDFAALAPELGQVFFIGDGKTAAGALQRFVAPAGATRLYLGFVGSGSAALTAAVRFGPSAPSDPAPFEMPTLSATLGLQPSGVVAGLLTRGSWGNDDPGFFAHAHSLDLVTKAPAAVGREPNSHHPPRYGILPPPGGVGPPTLVAVALPDRFGDEAALYVDTNQNGDLMDDAPISWKFHPVPKNRGHYSAAAWIRAGVSTTGAPPLMRIRFSTDRRGTSANLEGAREGRMRFPSGRVYALRLRRPCLPGPFDTRVPETPPSPKNLDDSPSVVLELDRDGDGMIQSSYEYFPLDRPFALDGVTYEALPAADGTQLVLRPSTVSVPERPVVRVGARFPAFTARALDGRTVRFPQDFAGKTVLLHPAGLAWTSAREPLRAAAAAYEGRGFALVGLGGGTDDPKSILTVCRKNGVSWPMIYQKLLPRDGVWSLLFPPGSMRSVGISFLVDGDTGEILAHSEFAVGKSGRATLSVDRNLPQIIEQALSRRAPPPKP